MEAEARRPLPEPDESSAAFWAAAARHVLTLAKCSRCGEMTLPSDVSCPHCLSTDPQFTFEPVSGHGRIRTWTVIRQSFLRGFADLVPFVLVDVELKDQPQVRIVARLLAPADAPLAVGMPVQAAFEDLAPGVAVPAFVLEDAA
ncbi:OB-fold domain-containing protein [Phenylobacterium sp. LjRoot219]|uniref:Zn-ribbon domain-containing OB-fold protein n=1 Tax=Phenylobacterium sp. LjRoot219 TaxID=3342283 RepID=UPI003ED07A3A